MLPCHNMWDLEEKRGRGFLNLLYGGKGVITLPQELTTELLCLELTTISASCGVKRYMCYSLNQFYLLDLFLFPLFFYDFSINL